MTNMLRRRGKTFTARTFVPVDLQALMHRAEIVKSMGNTDEARRGVQRYDLASRVFTPSRAEVTKASRIIEAMASAAKEGRGAVSLDGRLIDIASIRMAQALLTKADSIDAAAGK
jgi:hypothetical protein